MGKTTDGTHRDDVKEGISSPKVRLMGKRDLQVSERKRQLQRKNTKEARPGGCPKKKKQRRGGLCPGT